MSDSATSNASNSTFAISPISKRKRVDANNISFSQLPTVPKRPRANIPEIALPTTTLSSSSSTSSDSKNSGRANSNSALSSPFVRAFIGTDAIASPHAAIGILQRAGSRRELKVPVVTPRQEPMMMAAEAFEPSAFSLQAPQLQQPQPQQQQQQQQQQQPAAPSAVATATAAAPSFNLIGDLNIVSPAAMFDEAFRLDSPASARKRSFSRSSSLADLNLQTSFTLSRHSPNVSPRLDYMFSASASSFSPRVDVPSSCALSPRIDVERLELPASLVFSPMSEVDIASEPVIIPRINISPVAVPAIVVTGVAASQPERPSASASASASAAAVAATLAVPSSEAIPAVVPATELEPLPALDLLSLSALPADLYYDTASSAASAIGLSVDASGDDMSCLSLSVSGSPCGSAAGSPTLSVRETSSDHDASRSTSPWSEVDGSSSSVRSTKRDSRKKPRQCTVCQKVFSNNSSIQRHMLTHTGERPFSCEVCHKSFSQKGTLVTHMRVHNVATPTFYCPTCNQAFRHRNSAKRHFISRCGGAKMTPQEQEATEIPCSTSPVDGRHDGSEASAGV